MQRRYVTLSLARITMKRPNIGKIFEFALVFISILFALVIFYRSTLKLALNPHSGIIGGWDGAFYYFWLRSILFDWDLNFLNEITHYNIWNEQTRELALNQPLTSTGLIANKYSIGWALYSAPWMLVGHIFGLVIFACGFNILLDGYSAPYQTSLVIGQFVYASIALIYLYKFASNILETHLPIVYLSLFWLGSFLPFYQIFQTTMAHNVTLLSAAIVYWLAYRIRLEEERTDLRIWIMLGCVSGLLILSRIQAVVCLLYPFSVTLRYLIFFRFKKTYLYKPILAFLVFIITLLPQLLCWKLLYGDSFTYSYQGEAFLWMEPQLYNVLFSSFHGLFYWHPIYLFGLLGFLCWAIRVKNKKLEAICLGLSCVLTIYINAAWHCWWFGASFGSRAFETVSIPAFIGLCYILLQLRKHNVIIRIASCCIFSILALWNMNLTVVTIKGNLPLDRPVAYSEMRDISKQFWPNFVHNVIRN